jgi:hypothetical protein
MADMTVRESGWYADTNLPGFQRWWDGCGWTQYVRRIGKPAPAIGGVYATPPRKAPQAPPRPG